MLPLTNYKFNQTKEKYNEASVLIDKNLTTFTKKRASVQVSKPTRHFLQNKLRKKGTVNYFYSQ